MYTPDNRSFTIQKWDSEGFKLYMLVNVMDNIANIPILFFF